MSSRKDLTGGGLNELRNYKPDISYDPGKFFSNFGPQLSGQPYGNPMTDPPQKDFVVPQNLTTDRPPPGRDWAFDMPGALAEYLGKMAAQPKQTLGELGDWAKKNFVAPDGDVRE